MLIIYEINPPFPFPPETPDTQAITTAKHKLTPLLTLEVHAELVFLSVINIVLSITAFWGTSRILVALHKDTSIHPKSKLL